MLALDSKVQTTSKHVCQAVRRSVIDNNARASSVVNGGRCISGVSALMGRGPDRRGHAVATRPRLGLTAGRPMRCR